MTRAESSSIGLQRGKRNLILDTALGLFVENGYLDTKIIDIANKAGIGKGTIYEYFSSKEALFTELLKLHVVDRYASMEDEIRSDGASCREQLRRYIRYDAEIALRFGNGKNYLDQLCRESSLYQYPDLGNTLFRLQEYRLSTLISIITEGIAKGDFAPINPMAAAVSIMGAIGAFISYGCGLLSGWGGPPEIAVEKENLIGQEDTLLNLLLYGLAAPDTRCG